MSDDKVKVVPIAPSNLLDLEDYRRRRIEEGTWPPPSGSFPDYWHEFLERRKKR